MKARIYTRISDDKQVSNTSLENQESVCRTHCRLRKHKVIGILKDEGVSAYKTNTQRVVDLLDYCKNNKNNFDVLVIFNFDRLARSVEHHLLIKQELKKIDILVESATEQVEDSHTGHFLETIIAAKNELDNDIRRTRAISGMIGRLKQGLWPWNPPIGYYLPKEPNKRLCTCLVDSNTAPAITEMFERYSTGLYTLKAIAGWMNKKKLVKHNGAKPRFYEQVIEKMLVNKFYCGILQSSINDFQEHIGQHEAIITEELFILCQRIKNKKKSKVVRKKINPDFPLRGLLYGRNGHKLTAANSKGRFGYYFCQHRDCGNWKSKTVHDQFIEHLHTIQPAQEDIDLYFEIFGERMVKSFDSHTQTEKRYLFRLDDLKKKKSRLIEMRANNELELDEYLEGKLAIKTEINSIKSDLVTTNRAKVEYQEVLKYGKEFITDIAGKYQELKKVEQKIAYTGAIFNRGVDYNGEFLSHRKPLEILTACSALNSDNVTPQGIEPWFTG